MRGRHRLGRSTLGWTLLVGLVVLTGCKSNPTAAEHDDELVVEFTVEPGHVHILQSEVTYSVRVLDHHGEAVTDFIALEVQRLLEGDDTWRGTALELHGDTYEATVTFASSGEYELRIAGQRPGESDLMVLHHVAEHLHAAHAHEEGGGYRVEFETFPGHLHEGDVATAAFWIMETEPDEANERPPIGGLSTEVHILESDGTTVDLTPVESETGRYDVSHTFHQAGATEFTIHFTGSDGLPAEVTFHHDVAHAH